VTTINPAVLALLTGLPGAGLWAFGRLRRLSAVLIAATAALLAVAVPEWTGTLAALTGTTNGVIELLAVLIVSGIAFFFEVFHTPRTKTRDGNTLPPSKVRHHYHRIRTMATAAVFGTAVVVAKLRSADLSKAAKASPALAKQALNEASVKVNNGQAAAAVTGHQQQIVWLVVAVIVIGLIWLMVQVEKRKPGAKRRSKSSSGFLRKMLGSGKGGRTGARAIGGGE
jgi:hypothetical protein